MKVVEFFSEWIVAPQSGTCQRGAIILRKTCKNGPCSGSATLRISCTCPPWQILGTYKN